MEENTHRRPTNPRRRQRSKIQIFKEAYLPVIIAGIALILILIFIIGAITRAVQNHKIQVQAQIEASESLAAEQLRQQEEAQYLLEEARKSVRHFDYGNAIALLDSFSGDISQFPELSIARDEYQQAIDALIHWEDPNQIPNLSFHQLIVTPERAFADPIYSKSYLRNHITLEEFSQILQQLYENGYILVQQSDVMAGTVYLPEGKKPIIFTQTNVNYYTYMIDSDGDKLPDKDGAGFASKLIVDANGNLTCEMVDSSGQIVTGAYDLVPILNAFVETHPDFSYKGAKATLAVSGFEGLFGYRTDEESRQHFGEDYWNSEVSAVSQLINVLYSDGYEIACYTFRNAAYGEMTAQQIQEDMALWSSQVAPILGNVNTLVFAKNSDIAANSEAYAGEKFDVLNQYGFTAYIGFCADNQPFYSTYDGYIRQGRLMVAGTNLTQKPDLFTGIFDASTLVDAARTAAQTQPEA